MPVTLPPSFVPVETIANRTMTVDELKAEPSLLSTNPVMALQLGGPFTRDFVTRCLATPEAQAATAAGFHAVVDVRTQRLEVGKYPSVPGWHCDLVPLGAGAQPDFSRVNPQAVHFLLLLATEDDGVSLTEYLPHPFTFEPNPQAVWASLQAAIVAARPETAKVETGIIYRFDSFAAHDTSPATTRGWRSFFRLTFQKSPAIGNRVLSPDSVQTF
jgi:hypothetical protein